MEEISFYKLRVIDIVKKLLNGLDVNNVPETIRLTFEKFVTKCIQHFQLLDRNEIIQKEIESYTNLTTCSHEVEVAPLFVSKKINPFFEKALKKKRGGEKIFIPKERVIDLKNPAFRKKNILEEYDSDFEEENSTEEKNEKVELQS